MFKKDICFIIFFSLLILLNFFIFYRYFSLQATNPLGFSDQVRFEVEANICREEGPLPDCFLKPVKILTQYLEKVIISFLIFFL